jgi:hypothetical protein
VSQRTVFIGLGVLLFILGVGLITALGPKEYWRYSATEIPDPQEAQDPTAFTALPSDERQIAERLIDGEVIESEIYHFHPFGASFVVTHIDNDWQLGRPTTYRDLVQSQPISYNGRVYSMLPRGINDDHINFIPFWISGGLLIIGGSVMCARALRGHQKEQELHWKKS